MVPKYRLCRICRNYVGSRHVGRQLVLYVPLLLILNRLFGFSGMIKAQPVTELIMMIVSVSLLRGLILRQQAHREERHS